MQNVPPEPTESELEVPRRFNDRRKKHHNGDILFVFVVGFNVVSWLLLIAALFFLHYARPEFITGVQTYWGIEGRESWSEEHLSYLLSFLQFCLVTTLVSIVLRTRRTRRKTDHFGYNLIALLIVAVISLITIYSIV